MTRIFLSAILFMFSLTLFIGCNNADTTKATTDNEMKSVETDTPRYFNLRPALEKEYGYTHAVKLAMTSKSPVQ